MYTTKKSCNAGLSGLGVVDPATVIAIARVFMNVAGKHDPVKSQARQCGIALSYPDFAAYEKHMLSVRGDTSVPVTKNLARQWWDICRNKPLSPYLINPGPDGGPIPVSTTWFKGAPAGGVNQNTPVSSATQNTPVTQSAISAGTQYAAPIYTSQNAVETNSAETVNETAKSSSGLLFTALMLAASFFMGV